MLDRAKAHLTQYEVDTKMSIESVLHILRMRKSTAHIEIVVTGGGIRAITVTEKTKPSQNFLDKGENREVLSTL